MVSTCLWKGSGNEKLVGRSGVHDFLEINSQIKEKKPEEKEECDLFLFLESNCAIKPQKIAAMLSNPIPSTVLYFSFSSKISRNSHPK